MCTFIYRYNVHVCVHVSLTTHIGNYVFSSVLIWRCLKYTFYKVHYLFHYHLMHWFTKGKIKLLIRFAWIRDKCVFTWHISRKHYGLADICCEYALYYAVLRYCTMFSHNDIDMDIHVAYNSTSFQKILFMNRFLKSCVRVVEKSFYMYQLFRSFTCMMIQWSINPNCGCLSLIHTLFFMQDNRDVLSYNLYM